MKKNAKFWMVWGDGRSNPTLKHQNEQSARNEAERLAKQFGGKFFVLEVVASCERNEVQWTNLNFDDSDPFADE